MTQIAGEAAASGRAVELSSSRRHLVAAVVAGIGYQCIEPWLAPTGSTVEHLRSQGYDLTIIKVDPLSSSARNAREIRDAVMAMPDEETPPRLVLVGYSKGAPDILEAIVGYPEIRARVAAVVSVAGAVGGSPLANDFDQYHADLMRHFPKATCDSGDGGAVQSLRPDVRKTWLAEHPLPSDVPYYSVPTLPNPGRISRLLQSSYRKLARIDAHNDSQLIFYDELIPNSTLLGYLNADHWAVALPIARTHRNVGRWFVTQNDYPREALLEAILRFVEEDLDARGSGTSYLPRANTR